MSSRDWSEFFDGESSVHGNDIPPSLGDSSPAISPEIAQEINRISDLRKLEEKRSVELRQLKEKKAIELIGTQPTWWADACEEEEYLDMSYQGQYEIEALEKVVMRAGAPSLVAFNEESRRQIEIRKMVEKLEFTLSC